MEKSPLYKATIITFILIPVLAVIRLTYSAPHLNYGEGYITVNSIFLLLFAIYAFFVSAKHFIRCHNFWKIGDSHWKSRLAFTYIFIFIVALSLPLLMTFQDRAFIKEFVETLAGGAPAFLLPISIILFFLGSAGLRYLKTRPKLYLFLIFYILIFIVALTLPFFVVFQAKAFYSEDFIVCLRCVSPAFLFPIGVLLFFIGLEGLQHFKARAKLYLLIIFFTSAVFSIGGAPSALLVFAWWIKGGISPW